MKKLKLKKIDLSKFKIKKPKLNKINFSKYKINKEKLQKKLPLAIGVILIITALAVFPNTLSRYASSGVSGTNINVAYSLLDVIQNDNGTCSDTAGDNITTGLYCDAHHTYFYKFTFPLDISDSSKFLTMTYGQKQWDTVTLHYSLPESFNTSAYQDIIELLSIKVHAEQYVKDK